MVYCTIEEAWNESLNPELLNQNQINNHTGYDPKLGYHNIELENSTIYNSKGESLTRKKNKKNTKNKTPNFSRTYNRLPEHSGPKTRFTKDNQRVHVRSSDGTKLDSKENHPSYMNVDLPINDHNISMYEKLNDEYNRKQDTLEESSLIDGVETESNTSKSESFMVNRKNRHSNNYIHIINELREENSKLKTLVNELKNSKGDNKDTFLDLVVFIATGIIIILMMENITKLLRKF
tara:strand:- start:1339 stop:2043 length:705 start_codon:yes stop_codon:yes gene_type:complete